MPSTSKGSVPPRGLQPCSLQASAYTLPCQPSYYLLHTLCYLPTIRERAAEASPSKGRGSGMTAKTGPTQMHQPIIKTCDATSRPRPRLRDMTVCHSESSAYRQQCILRHKQIKHCPVQTCTCVQSLIACNSLACRRAGYLDTLRHTLSPILRHTFSLL